MLVEDDETTNFYNEFLIKELGIAKEIVIRQNGEEALNYLERCSAGEAEIHPDLIFLDINMPVMDGFEFLEAFEKRNLDALNNVMIVMLTTSLHPDDLQRAKSFRSVSEYVYKPLMQEKISEIVSRYFSN